MRIFNALLMLLMILFGAVQYNDPDGIRWMALYAVPAAWAAVAAFRRPALQNPIVTGLLFISTLTAAAGLFWFWPDTPGWWRQEVWWQTETAREGMGMMVIAIVLLVVWLSRPSASL